MLSEKDKEFITYWEAERERQSTFSSKLLRGLPMAMVFGFPIVLFVVVVNLFFPEWYTRISNTSSGTFVTIVLAVIICIVFFSYFRMHYKWEMNEQLYQELKQKQSQQSAS